ncbi:MAG: glycosyltransferase [Rikenellaceae bacterium]|nr:glycosyltransferase [Rikenellaceae bacterium]
MKSQIKNITLLGPAYPYRGGLAAFIETLAAKFRDQGKNVNIYTFTLQYPSVLFPGKSQFSESDAPEGLTITRLVNSINPFNWIRTGMVIKRDRPDILIMKYWLPLMAPCFGTISRIARSNGHTKVIVQLDNVVPHEKRLFDTLLTKYFIGSCDGFIYMSGQVREDLEKFDKTKPSEFAPHPIYDLYGERVDKKDACKFLNINPDAEYCLFFGFIRDYKGLDILIDAWKLLKDKGFTKDKKLIVAGEYYGDKEKYRTQINRSGLESDIILFDRFIKDEEVKYYFSAASLLVQPYKTATQSGVTQIAYHFGLPMVVTDVGGLAELIPDGKVGYVTKPDPRYIAEYIEKYFSLNKEEEFRKNIESEKKRFSWENMTGKIESLYGKITQK